MTYEEITAIIADFTKKNPDIAFADKVHGIVVADTDKGFRLQLLVVEEKDLVALNAAELIPESYTYSHDSKEKNIKTEVVVKPFFTASLHPDINNSTKMNSVPVRAGDAAFGDGLAGYGTAGWNVYLNGTLVSVSNWHVYCPMGNNTPVGNRVFINNSDVASLFTFQRVSEFGYNIWDYALAKFDNPVDVAGEMRKCEDGSVYPYPQKLSDEVSLGSGEIYYKVGAKSPICRTGSFISGIGNIIINYDNGTRARFQNQLFFTEMNDGGDSGSVVVRKSDNSVTGLIFGKNDKTNEAVANPFFKIGWNFTGSFKNTNGHEFPVFTSGMKGTGFDTLALQNNEVKLFDDPIPKFVAGKLFLGISTGIVYTPGGPDPNNPPRPVWNPIRDVPVEYIPIAPLPDGYNAPFYVSGDQPNSQRNPRIWLFLAFG